MVVGLPPKPIVYPKIPQEENTDGSLSALGHMMDKQGGVVYGEQHEAGIQISGCSLPNG